MAQTPSVQKIQPVRGTRDLIGAEQHAMADIATRAALQAERMNFIPIETPMFEYTQVFHRLGEASDIVEKETYTFHDRGGDALTLRPEGTASVARALISNGLTQNLPQKFYYHGPMFRYDRPQKGRYRQFNQFSVEYFGVAGAAADVACILLAEQILEELGIKKYLNLELNTLGDLESRKRYEAALKTFYEQHKAALSPESQRRLQANPLRILDSKDSQDQKVNADAPEFSQHLTDTAKAFFDKVCRLLADLQITFTHNKQLVRGLDYYCHTAFEYTTSKLGAQATVLAGGRYDGLVENLGGPAIPAVGWAMGVDRAKLLMPATHALAPDLVMIPMGDQAEGRCLRLSQEFTALGLRHDILWQGNVRKRMQKAEKLEARWTCVIGDDDLEAGACDLRDMQAHTTLSIALHATEIVAKIAPANQCAGRSS